MTRTQAVKLARRLVDAGVLEHAQPGAATAAVSKQIQGTSTIDGEWAGYPGLKASIICEHVAAALVETGRWCPEALGACRHDWRAFWVSHNIPWYTGYGSFGAWGKK